MTEKISRVDLLIKIREIIRTRTMDPTAEMRAHGEALIKIADALEDVSPQEAVAILAAVGKIV